MLLTCSYDSFIQKNIKSGLLVYGVSKVWKDTYGCPNKYKCALDMYLMTVFSYLYGIIIYHAINAPGHINNAVYGINTTDKRYLK